MADFYVDTDAVLAATAFVPFAPGPGASYPQGSSDLDGAIDADTAQDAADIMPVVNAFTHGVATLAAADKDSVRVTELLDKAAVAKYRKIVGR
ncbi:hypothetical protein [Tsukamurella soli]|uniref:Uncharacterized protein n=1 Tax=Tsukamurella soli TaxID=644556 RepID=A0ABP8J108_9ACTN